MSPPRGKARAKAPTPDTEAARIRDEVDAALRDAASEPFWLRLVREGDEDASRRAEARGGGEGREHAADPRDPVRTLCGTAPPTGALVAMAGAEVTCARCIVRLVRAGGPEVREGYAMGRLVAAHLDAGGDAEDVLPAVRRALGAALTLRGAAVAAYWLGRGRSHEGDP